MTALSITARCGEGEIPRIAKGDKSVAADDEVVVESDRHDAACFDEHAGELDVRFRGCGIAAGVIVGDDEAISVVPDSGIENFARVDEHLRECAD